MQSIFRRFLEENSGATAPEYAVVLALIVVVCITAVQSVGTAVDATFQSVAANMSPSKAPNGMGMAASVAVPRATQLHAAPQAMDVVAPVTVSYAPQAGSAYYVAPVTASAAPQAGRSE